MGKILVIDDDYGTTKLLEVILSKEGYEVIAINNSCDTIPTAQVQDPSLILLDLMMPSPDGLELCRSLRTESQFARIPIVFFTSASDIEKKVAAFASGASDYIVKPVHPQELTVRIKTLLGNGRSNSNGHNGNGHHKGA